MQLRKKYKMNKQEVIKKLTKTKNCMDNETDYKMVDLATILNLLRVEGNQKIFIIDEDGAPLKYGVDDISLELDSRVSELVIYDNHVEIDLEYY